MRAFVWLVAMMLLTPSVHAEVRVFVLKIAKKDDPQDARLVTSTLDPRQYRGYYPIRPDETITYVDTWRCPGRTGDFKPLCPNPREIAAETTTGGQSPENKP